MAMRGNEQVVALLKAPKRLENIRILYMNLFFLSTSVNTFRHSSCVDQAATIRSINTHICPMAKRQLGLKLNKCTYGSGG